MNSETWDAIRKSAKGLYRSTPILLGVILLVGLSNQFIPKEYYSSLFRGELLLDSLTGAALGSILAGNPISSYVLGGEMLSQGVSLVAITAFIVTWVTVGLVQFPAESLLLGRKFAITRNVVSFLSAIAVAALTIGAMML